MSPKNKRLETRLSNVQRPLAILLAGLLIASSIPMPVGAELTTEEWRTNIGEDSQEVQDIAYADGKVIVATRDFSTPSQSRLVALDASDGSEVWNVTGLELVREDGMAVLPDEGKVYLTSDDDGNMFVFDLDDGSVIASSASGDEEYRALAANRADNRLYGATSGSGVDPEIRELSITDGSSTGTAFDVDVSRDYLEVDNRTGDIYGTLAGGSDVTSRFNSELTVKEWDNQNGGVEASPGANAVFVGEGSTLYKLDKADGSELDTANNGDALNDIDATNSTLSVFTVDSNGNLTEWEQSSLTQTDTVELFPTDSAESIAVSEDRDEAVAFVGSDSGEVVRYNTDVLTVDGDEQIDFDVQHYMEHGDVASYEVEATVFNETSGEFETVDATDVANVTSLNTSVVTVNDNTNELVATSDTNINNQIGVRAEYQNLTTEENVTVAEQSIENLDILPPMRKMTASVQDETMKVIILATMIGVAITLLSTSFAGLGSIVVVMVAGWLMDMVPDGIIIVTVFMAMFVGMNVAGNIDYQVRR